MRKSRTAKPPVGGESKELLRETLDRYVRDLAEELLYWVDQLNKLETQDSLKSGAVSPVETRPWPKAPGLDSDAEAPTRVQN